MRWRQSLDPLWVDIGLVAAVVAAATLGLAATTSDPGTGSPLRWALGVAVALPLLGRRHFPEAVLIVITAAAVIQGTLLRSMPGFDAFLALLIGAFSVGSHAGRVSGLIAMAGCLIGVLLVGAVAEPLSLEGVVIPFVYLGAAWGIGRLVGTRTAKADRIAAAAARLTREQADRERALIADERARISRELHDVVAHAVTTMVLQAGAAQAELDPDDTATQSRLATIEASGREALDELRRVLAVTRETGAAGVEDPMPSLADLPALAARTSASGLAVDLSVDVDHPLPAGLSLSIYRIVQEALTNTLRHASATRASVRVCRTNGDVVVEISDDGRPPPGRAAPRVGTGHGLVGMRERVAMFGGTVEIGPDPGGGFHVRARVPDGRDLR